VALRPRIKDKRTDYFAVTLKWQACHKILSTLKYTVESYK